MTTEEDYISEQGFRFFGLLPHIFWKVFLAFLSRFQTFLKSSFLLFRTAFPHQPGKRLNTKRNEMTCCGGQNVQRKGGRRRSWWGSRRWRRIPREEPQNGKSRLLPTTTQKKRRFFGSTTVDPKLLLSLRQKGGKMKGKRCLFFSQRRKSHHHRFEVKMSLQTGRRAPTPTVVLSSPLVWLPLQLPAMHLSLF